MPGLTAQVIHGRCLELGQGGIPEETERRHHQRQPPVAGAGEHPGKGQCGQEGGDADNGDAPAGVISDPTPDIGRDDLGCHQDRSQLPDFRNTEIQRLEVEAPVGNQGP